MQINEIACQIACNSVLRRVMWQLSVLKICRQKNLVSKALLTCTVCATKILKSQNCVYHLPSAMSSLHNCKQTADLPWKKFFKRFFLWDSSHSALGESRFIGLYESPVHLPVTMCLPVWRRWQSSVRQFWQYSRIFVASSSGSCLLPHLGSLSLKISNKK